MVTSWERVCIVCLGAAAPLGCAPAERASDHPTELASAATVPSAAGPAGAVACEGQGSRAAAFSASFVLRAGAHLVLADVEADAGAFSITEPARGRRSVGRRYRLRLQDQSADVQAALPERLEVNVHEASFLGREPLGRAVIASPEGKHTVAIGQRVLLTLLADAVDPAHLRVVAAVPVQRAGDTLQMDAYGAKRGDDARATLAAVRRLATSARVEAPSGGAR